jgi:SNF2 family DNA or RNA helicase
VPEVDYILWLTPCRTIDNLRAELDKWGAEHIHIAGIESLSSSDRLFLDIQRRLDSAQCPFIVVDESLKIKNWDAIRTKRILELGRKAQYKLILNGTPISRNILDLWAQMEFLSPRILNMDMAEFKNTFCEWTKVTKRMGGKTLTREWIVKHHNVDYLYSMIGHYVYECDLDLKLRQQFITLPYRLDAEERKTYTELKKRYLDSETLAFLNNNIFLEMTQKMQATYCTTADKFRRLREVLASNDPDSVIVFTKYIASREALQEAFPKLKVLSYGMHAFGLNLQDHNVTVFWDKTWDYAQREQAERRTYRTGQQQDCIYYDLTGDVGLEELIDKNIAGKLSLLDYVKQASLDQLKTDI